MSVVLSGRRPDADNWFVEPVVAGWWQAWLDGGNAEKEHAIQGTRFRASWAGSCARALAYRFAGFEESDPITVADAWRFNVGTMLHQHIQAAVMERYPGSEIEIKVKLDTDGSGHMDMLVLHPDGKRSSVEIKTINGTGYRRMVCGERGPAEGPRSTYVLQGAINAHGMDPRPDELVIAVFSLENLSPGTARKAGLVDEYKRFAVQYTFDRDEYMEIAERELTRINKVISYVDSEPEGWAKVPREMPDPKLPKHRVFDPTKGYIEKLDRNGKSLGTDWVWQCSYCPFQSVCADHIAEGK